METIELRAVPIPRADVFECIDLLKLAYYDDSDQVNALIKKLENLLDWAE